MRDVFDILKSEGESGIDRLIAERTQENVQLDFKVKRNARHGCFDDEDKKVYGKALSAFANSSGGLLIWGVDARKGTDQIDCAQAPGQPIADIERFRSEAIRFAGDLLIPRHDGIHIEAIPSAAATGSGYLLVYVERSERRPHRCEAKGEKQYFKRAGDSSFAMEHYDIEDAFNRLSFPKLNLGVRISVRPTNSSKREFGFEIDLYLENISAITAEMPYLQMRGVKGVNGGVEAISGINYYMEDDWLTCYGENSSVVHPGISRTMASFKINMKWDGKVKNNLPYHRRHFHAECRYGCKNIVSENKNIIIDEQDLQKAVPH